MRKPQIISLALVLILEWYGYPTLPSPQQTDNILIAFDGKEIGTDCLSLVTWQEPEF